MLVLVPPRAPRSVLQVQWTAKVIQRSSLTPSVVGLQLEVQEPCRDDPAVRARGSLPQQAFSFRCGQWVDFSVPGLEEVGGYSICSPPSQLPLLELAVRRAERQPARWVRESATAGQAVALRVGGNVWHSVDRDPHRSSRSLVLIGGGIGMSPLMATLREWAAWRLSPDGAAASSTLTLLQSAASEAELVWRDEVTALQAALPDGALGVHYSVTAEADADEGVAREAEAELAAKQAAGPASWFGPGGLLSCGSVHRARTGPAALRLAAAHAGDHGGVSGRGGGSSFGNAGPSGEEEAPPPLESGELLRTTPGPLWYPCGSPGMLADVLGVLGREAGVPASRVRFERW